MKYDSWFFKYLQCDTEQEQADLIALCELLGMKPYSQDIFEFSLCRWVLIDGRGTYLKCCEGAETVPSMNIKASDFIAANF